MYETWKPIDGWNGIYEVSDFGNVRRILEGKGTRGPNRILRPGAEKGGYLHVTLQYFGRKKLAKIHQLVLAAFVGPRGPKQVVNHKDGNTANNNLCNLEYCSNAANIKHSYAVLNRVRKGAVGTRNSKAKLTEDCVREIRRRYAAGDVSQQSLADQFGVNQTMIGFIVRREHWSHVN